MDSLYNFSCVLFHSYWLYLIEPFARPQLDAAGVFGTPAMATEGQTAGAIPRKMMETTWQKEGLQQIKLQCCHWMWENGDMTRLRKGGWACALGHSTRCNKSKICRKALRFLASHSLWPTDMCYDVFMNKTLALDIAGPYPSEFHGLMWWFPEIGVPPNQQFSWDFPL